MDSHALSAVPTGPPLVPPAPTPAVPDVRYGVVVVDPDPRLRMVLAARLPIAVATGQPRDLRCRHAW